MVSHFIELFIKLVYFIAELIVLNVINLLVERVEVRRCNFSKKISNFSFVCLFDRRFFLRNP